MGTGKVAKAAEQSFHHVLWSVTPFKEFYILAYLLITILVHVPLWVIQYFIPFSVVGYIWNTTSGWHPRYGVLVGRPFKDWSLTQYIIVRWFRHITFLVVHCRLKLEIVDNTVSPKGLKKSTFVLIPPVSEDRISGFVAKAARKVNVRPAPVGAYWYKRTDPLLAPSAEDDLVALNFHGGGYVLGDATENDFNVDIVNGILKVRPVFMISISGMMEEQETRISRVFSVDYRLSTGTPFPGALLDALSAYVYLTETENIDPSQIVVMGDSAGGNLSLALLRLIRSLSLPMPGHAILLSPWADIANSHFNPGSPFRNARTARRREGDVLNPNLGPYTVYKFTEGHHPSILQSAYLSPALLPLPQGEGEEKEESPEVSFKGFPRTFVSIGEGEVLHDQIHTLVERMREGGVDVRERVEEGGVHDFVGFKWFEPQRGLALKAIGKWLKEEV
ncbi:alpha/beta-hydrolase [Atractiella rhizophila]|nr:alpha/beta-hydrolase [Atractiella rhizophila]